MTPSTGRNKHSLWGNFVQIGYIFCYLNYVLKILERATVGSTLMVDNNDDRDIVNLILTHLETEKGLVEELVFKDRMMGILGHDLRNPLTAVKMAAHVLNRPNELSAESHKNVLAITHAADRMAEMIETLLDITRARHMVKVPITRRPCDLGKIASDVVEETKIAWPSRSIELEMQGNLQGDWDSARLAQVISNLIGNGVHHGDPMTPVQVFVSGEGENVLLVVHNKGPVISPEKIPGLFDPFRRGVSDPGSSIEQGLGLGLYIVKQIILSHEGTIDVESTQAKGTTFTISLPRGKVQENPSSSGVFETL